MLIIGLTGGIASGKSTVSNRLNQKYQIPIIDADLIARQVVEPGQPAYNQIITHFNSFVPNLISEDRKLNRPALGKAVFGNDKELKVLNGIVHPAVRKEMLRQVLMVYLKASDMVVLDVPLLFEAKMDMLCAKTITVSCNLDTQLERLLSRNKELSKEDAVNRINSQMGNDEKNKRADIIIDNSTSLDDLYSQIENVVKTIKPSKFWVWVSLLNPIPALLITIYRYFVKSRAQTKTKSI